MENPISKEVAPETTPQDAATPAQNIVSGERVLQPPTQSEMLSEPQPAKPTTPPTTDTPIPDPLDMPQPTQLINQASPQQPAQPEKDYRPDWAQGQPMQDPAAGLSPKYKTGLPDGVYFTAGIMLIPLFYAIQLLFVMDFNVSGIGTIFQALKWYQAMTLISAIAAGAGALLLIFTRSKISRVISVASLLLFALGYIISFVAPSIQACSSIPGGSFSKICAITIVDNIAVVAVVIILAVYLSLPRVKASYGN